MVKWSSGVRRLTTGHGPRATSTMPPMFRRFFRIFCVTVLLILLSTAVIAQFCEGFLGSPHRYIGMRPLGLYLLDVRPYLVPTGWRRVTYWSPRYLINMPLWDRQFVICPWWLLLAMWGSLTAPIWCFTRRRKGPGGAFPVEPTTVPS